MSPRSTVVRFKFPAHEGMAPVTLTWWDGGLMPPRPEELEEGRAMGDADGGVLFIGDKGNLMAGCYGRDPRLVPESKMQEFKRPDPRMVDGRPRDAGREGGYSTLWSDGFKQEPSSRVVQTAGPAR